MSVNHYVLIVTCAHIWTVCKLRDEKKQTYNSFIIDDFLFIPLASLLLSIFTFYGKCTGLQGRGLKTKILEKVLAIERRVVALSRN